MGVAYYRAASNAFLLTLDSQLGLGWRATELFCCGVRRIGAKSAIVGH
jgi:hypothetical protein